MSKIKTYQELCQLKTFEERFLYLLVGGKVGEETFGRDRYLNQLLYTSLEWRSLRRKIIERDKGCNLGVEGLEIFGPITIHHIEPITVEDVINRSPKVLNRNNLICVADDTHKAIHYGDKNYLITLPVERTPGDTCPWKRSN